MTSKANLKIISRIRREILSLEHSIKDLNKMTDEELASSSQFDLLFLIQFECQRIYDILKLHRDKFPMPSYKPIKNKQIEKDINHGSNLD